ncbi:MAG: DUF5069 domain-containing protein [Nitrospira sp.]|nr:DUF5069 domain-containing protein [Nitrospira sp.]
MNDIQKIRLRSPRASLGGYVLLPRLIDKVRLLAERQLPQDYWSNVLKAGNTLDGRFLTYAGVDAEGLRQAILSSQTDEDVLVWIQTHAKPTTAEDNRAWAEQLAAYRPDESVVEYRKRMYPELASIIDIALLSVFDLIDLDEGRLSLNQLRKSSVD